MNGRGVPMETQSPTRKLFAAGRIGMDLTAGSALNYLIVAGVVCAGLWAIIILTITA